MFISERVKHRIEIAGVITAMLASGAIHKEEWISEQTGGVLHAVDDVSAGFLKIDDIIHNGGTAFGGLLTGNGSTAPSVENSKTSVTGPTPDAATAHTSTAKSTTSLPTLTQIIYHEQACMEKPDWTTQRKLGLLVIFGVEQINGQTTVLLNDQKLDQVMLMETPAHNVKAFKKELTVENGVPFSVFANIEGAGQNPFPQFALPSEAQVARMSPAAAERIVYNYAVKVKAMGVDQGLGPVVDENIGKDALKDRTFESNPEKIVTYSLVYEKAEREAGIDPTPKHFPRGLDAASNNVLPTAPPLQTLIKQGALKPYQALVTGGGTANVLISNDQVGGLTDGQPADLSSATTELLQEYVGLKDTVYISDNLNTPAILNLPSIHNTLGRAAVAAIKAGVMPLIVFQPDVSDQAIQIQVGRVMGALEAEVKSGEISQAELDTMDANELAARGVACK